MSGEKELFRKRFIGGFNRKDVINYIATIKNERKESIEAKERAEKEVADLRRYVAYLIGELKKRDAAEATATAATAATATVAIVQEDVPMEEDAAVETEPEVEAEVVVEAEPEVEPEVVVEANAAVGAEPVVEADAAPEADAAEPIKPTRIRVAVRRH